MGGSGGGGGRYDPNDRDRLRQDAGAGAQDADFVANVNELLQDTLADVNTRDTELVRTRLDEIEAALGEDAASIDKLLFGGSVAKSTYVDGLSDVDALVVLRASEHEETSPRDLIGAFARTLRERLAGVEVEAVTKGTMAVSLKYSDGAEIQILPAFRKGDTIRLANEDGSGWRSARPGSFASALTQCNQYNGGKVVPVIKLAKLVIAELPKARRPSGYHVEAMAVEAFKGYAGAKDLKSMVTHFFASAAEIVRTPIADRTGQSRHVDDKLGPAGSLERNAVSDSLARVARRMGTASMLEQWRATLGLDG